MSRIVEFPHELSLVKIHKYGSVVAGWGVATPYKTSTHLRRKIYRHPVGADLSGKMLSWE